MRTIVLVSCVSLVSGLAGDGAWKTKPAIPELQQSSPTEPSSERQKWDAFRFAKQSSKFVTLPNPFKSNKVRVVEPGETLWKASEKNDFDWFPLDDVVMGGVSESGFEQNSGVWSGTVTEANNGGFVGIRTSPSFQLDMSKCKGIELKIANSNGRRFKFIVRDSTDFNGICWTSSFDSPKSNIFSSVLKKTENFSSVKIPFNKQIPTIFARSVPGQTFDLSNVVGFQCAYSKFEYDGDLNKNFELGDFSLQLIEVCAY